MQNGQPDMLTRFQTIFSAILGHVVFKSGQRCTTFTLFHGSPDKAPTVGRRVTHHPCGIWHRWALARSSRGKGAKPKRARWEPVASGRAREHTEPKTSRISTGVLGCIVEQLNKDWRRSSYVSNLKPETRHSTLRTNIHYGMVLTRKL